MRTLYLESGSGISGDMTVGALLDLGADREVLKRGLDSLGVGGYHLHFGRANKAGIDAYDFDVHLEEVPHHHHDTEYTHDHHHDGEHTHGHHHDGEHTHDHHHDGEHTHDHHHDGEHTHDHHHDGDHVHRNLADVVAIINGGALTEKAKAVAIRIFTIVAEAEAKAHGLPIEQVHFHEVGAIDSIVDVVGAAICLDNLNVDRVLCTPLAEGSGTVKCAHGVMQVPVPAVVNIAKNCQVPLQITEVKGELVTPTGIAIAAAITDEFTRPSNLNIVKVGFGAGNKNLPDRANILRAFILEDDETPRTDSVVLMETNIDDQTGESLSYACQTLRELGALDVWLEPIYMKKERPAQKLCVLCKVEQEAVLAKGIFKYTSSIGVRRQILQRHVMERSFETVSTKYGDITVKINRFDDICKPTVEFESAKVAAESFCVTIEQVTTETLSKFWHA